MKSTANPDYDTKFQDDLEKAKALSMETFALENYKLLNRKLQPESSTSTSQTRSVSLTG